VLKTFDTFTSKNLGLRDCEISQRASLRSMILEA
jgi:hypothetical protein